MKEKKENMQPQQPQIQPQQTPQYPQPPIPSNHPLPQASHIAGQPTSNVSDKEFIPAFILSYFIGVFGADRFYLGHNVIGVLKLITLGGCGLWAMIDFVILCMGGMKDKQGRPLADYEKHRGWARVVGIVLLVINLLVVIFVAISLVLVSFTGTQQRARDTERQTDIKTIHGSIEVYHQKSNAYPSLSELNSKEWRQMNLQGVSSDNFKAPDNESDAFEATAGKNTYGYAATTNGGATCDNVAKPCEAYTLTAVLESGGTYTKNNL